MSQPNKIIPKLSTVCFDCGKELPTDDVDGELYENAHKDVEVRFPEDWYDKNGKVMKVILMRQVCLSCFSQNGYFERHHTDFGKHSNNLFTHE